MVPVKNLLQNLALIIFGVVLALSISELVMRIVYEPVDYLRAEPTKHEILGHKLLPGQAGHDNWGFRNQDTLSQCDILAIGDSQTYGVSAKASESWPSQLAGMSNQTVYNLSLGGYGPLEYLHLLEEYENKIRFNHLIIGFYIGNDLVDAYRSTYSIDYNDSYRMYPFDSIEKRGDSYAIYDMKEVKDRPFKTLRIWLANNSLTYRVLTHSGLGDFIRKKELQEDDNSCYAKIESDKTLLTPELRISTVDLEEPKVGEGWRISKDAMKGIKKICDDKKSSLTILIIPTKEMVYVSSTKVGSCNKMNKLEIKSNKFEKALNNFLELNSIQSIRAFHKQGKSQTSFFPQQDSHPNKIGYRKIAKNIYDQLVD